MERVTVEDIANEVKYGRRESVEEKAKREALEAEIEDLQRISDHFRLNLGQNIDKFLAVVTGEYKCPKFPGEPDRITQPAVGDKLFMDDYFSYPQWMHKYEYEKTTEPIKIKSFEECLKEKQKKQHLEDELLSQITPKQERIYPEIKSEISDVMEPENRVTSGAARMVINVPDGWTVTVSSSQVILEAPKA